MKTPWHDDAVVIRAGISNADREQVHHGALWQVLDWIRQRPDRALLTVFLPERRVAPLSFDQEQIDALLRVVDRPRSSIGFE